jgi:hypothetical protein
MGCILKYVIEGKTKVGVEVTERQGKIRKQLLDELKEKSGYWIFKETAVDRTL